MNDNVFLKKDECCGCGACANICPQRAIKIEKDEYGFTYPKTDKTKCNGCKLCEKVCLYKNSINLNKPIECYAGLSYDDNVCHNSASGGIFYSIALESIKEDFVIYGSFMSFKNSKPIVKHIRVEEKGDLNKLQGSKYVQSDIFSIFLEVEKDLINKKKVLFSGTPCQVQSIKRYLAIKKISLNNFYSIDIICHGVPSQDFFSSYIDSLYKKYDKTDFNFRDKNEGWGHMSSITIKKNNKTKRKRVYPKISSYYQLFLNSDINRESCYNCKFCKKNRIGDITIGDFWGIEKTYPNYLKRNGGKLNEKNGISCILINTDKGKQLFKLCSSKLLFEKSSLQNIAKYNYNLSKLSNKGKNREVVFKIYKENKSFSEINKWFRRKLGVKYYLYKLWINIPYKIREKLRNIRRKLIR